MSRTEPLKKAGRQAMSFGDIEVEITNPGKVMFPRDGYTKGDLIDYYHRIAPVMLRHMSGRPVSMVRYPEGIDGESFFQKDASPFFPSWLRRVKVVKKGGTVDHVVCDKPADLVYLANIACITPHIWLSREDHLDRPDRMILDLDPSDHDFNKVIDTALSLRDVLKGYGLPTYVMTTGSKGLHVVVPLDRSSSFDEVRDFARRVALEVIDGREEEFTLDVAKSGRGGRLLLDVFRNSYAQTGVAPYSIRAKDGAPVATPLRWSEVEGKAIGPTSFNMRNIFERLDSAGDPWADIDARPGKISVAVRSSE